MTAKAAHIAVYTHPVSLLEDPDRIRAAHRGEVMHLVLYFLERVTDQSDIRRAVDRAFALQGSTTTGWDLERDFVTPLEQARWLPEVRPWFAEDTTNLREADVVDAKGELYRMDRLVIGNDAIDIIEFKVGHREEGHRSQVRLYQELVAAVFRKPARGHLLYIDEPAVVKVT